MAKNPDNAMERRYVLARGESIDALERAVNDLATTGYAPYGSVFLRAEASSYWDGSTQRYTSANYLVQPMWLGSARP